MMTELNDLFEQIFHSERNFKARADELKTLNGRIQAVHRELEQGRERLSTKQGELVVKNTKLADIEMEIKLLQLKKNVLESQQKDVAAEKDRIAEEYEDELNAVSMEREVFLQRLKKFSHCYDLHGLGSKYREEEDKKKVAVLQDELILLETELVEIESYCEDMKKLQQKLSDAECELKKERESGKDLKAKLLEQDAQIQQLKRDRLSNNPEINRLQSELDACKKSREEELCKELSRELEELQKECYHRQMRRQTARQSRKSTFPPGSKNGPQQYTLRLEPNTHSETLTESETVNLVDEEWFDEGMLDEFESASHDGDEEGIDLEDWDDIDEAELEEDMALNSPLNSVVKENDTTRARSQGHTSSGVAGNSSGQDGVEQVRTPAVLSVARVHSDMLSSPHSSTTPRKRPGESIFKPPKGMASQASSSTKRIKKVRFHY